MPIGGVVFFSILVFLRIHDAQNEDRKLLLKTKILRMDLLGAIQWGGTVMPWKSSRIVGLFIGCGLLGITFIVMQVMQGDEATIPVRV